MLRHFRSVYFITEINKTMKPKFTLDRKDRSDFRSMEKFEGKLFVNWIAANLAQDNYLKIMLTEQVRISVSRD